MGSLIYDIQEEIERGDLSFHQIAEKYHVPFDWVDTIAVELQQELAYIGEWENYMNQSCREDAY
jgi:hypothetical protein